MPVPPRALSCFAPARQMLISVFHSTTSNSTSMPISARLCCTNSFIGSGCIWPEPDAEIRILVFSGLPGP